MALAKQLQFLGVFCSTFPQSQVFVHVMLLLDILSLQSCNYSLHPKKNCSSHEENSRAELGLNVDPMATTHCYGPEVTLGLAAGDAKLCGVHTPFFPGSNGIAVPEACPRCEVL